MQQIDVREVLFLHQEQNDYKYVCHHLYDGDMNTGIVKLQIRRGPPGTKESLHFCFHGRVFENSEQALNEYVKVGKAPRGKGRGEGK